MAMDIGNWLKSLQLEQYEAAFHENAVTTSLLPTLTADDLKDLGITLVGHRRQLLNAIAALRHKNSAASSTAKRSPPRSTIPYSGRVSVAQPRSCQAITIQE